MTDGIDWKYIAGILGAPIAIGLITWGALNERVVNNKESIVDQGMHFREILKTREQTELTRYTGLKESVDRLEREFAELRGMLFNKKFGQVPDATVGFTYLMTVETPPPPPQTVPQPELLFQDEIRTIQAKIDNLLIKEKAGELSKSERFKLQELELDKEVWRLWQAWCDVDDETRLGCLRNPPGKH